MAPFKKGPDYIDAAWLSAAANAPCRNIDLFLMSGSGVLRSLGTTSRASDVAVIEGNRGLYDGMDAGGSYSSAELAKLLASPVVLTVDCTKSTRTIAAMVLGCQQIDRDVPLRGVVLNKVGGTRHEGVVRGAIERDCGITVLGVLPRIRRQLFPERHLGLVPPQEHLEMNAAIEGVAEVGEQYLDLDAFWSLAQQAPPFELEPNAVTDSPGPERETVNIGVFRDAAFQFYYPENLEALVREGARIKEISPLSDNKLPALDALYIGGGFPETLARRLSSNEVFLDSVRRQVENGLPVYAECGGAVYLGEKLLYESVEYPMVGVLPVSFGFRDKPQGHGYVELETAHRNPYFPVGTTLRGHEFHYTCVESSAMDDISFAFRVTRGFGFDGERDGLCRFNVLASYTHLHALGTDRWAPAVVQAARRFRIGRRDASSAPASEVPARGNRTS